MRLITSHTTAGDSCPALRVESHVTQEINIQNYDLRDSKGR